MSAHGRISWLTLMLGVLVVAPGCKDDDTGKDSPPPDTDTGGHDSDTATADGDADGYTVAEGDCDDADATIHPGADELCGGVDEDCDGLIDDEDELAAGEGTEFYTDADNDTWGVDTDTVIACVQPAGFAARAGDCNDLENTIHPEATEDDCTDPTDYNCDGSVAYADVDTDGAPACLDCDDGDPRRSPDFPEVCSEFALDEDCDLLVDDADPDVTDTIDWYIDKDGDSYAADDAAAVAACVQPIDYVAVKGDCDDKAAEINPGATEVCDDADTDEDCNGKVDDEDRGLDLSTTTMFYADADGDLFGDPAATRNACELPAGYAANSSDCDDTTAARNPDEPEVCDGVDNDCDSVIDDEPVDGDLYAVDLDGDGFGAGGLRLACSGVDNDWDCDDTEPSEPVYVDIATGSAGGAGTTADPLDSIQAGIDLATSCVIVRLGTYEEAIDFSGKDLRVTGVDGPDGTVIDATGLGQPAAAFRSGETLDAALVGFTLQGGEGNRDSSSSSYACGSSETCTDYYDTWCGGGLYVADSSPTLAELVVRDNLLPESSTTTSGNDTWYVYSFGGGACFSNTASVLQRTQILGNFANTGGGVYLSDSANLQVERTTVQGNLAADGAGIFVEGGALTLGNVLLTGNEATGAGGALAAYGGTVDAVFSTVADNVAAAGLGMSVSSAASVTLENSVLAGDGAGTALLVVEAGSTLDPSWCDAWNASGDAYSGMTDPTGTEGNLSVDPSFVGTGDYHLAVGSPCVDAGDPSLLDPDGTVADQGAFGGPGGAW